MEKRFLFERYILLAIDPVHIGTGGYRLGRVDNTIVREPGTNLPKIPGTSLSGALRSFMALRNDKFPDCAGQGQAPDGPGEAVGAVHCGKNDCPVCMAFGFSRLRSSFQGLIQISDAHLLFFPVYSFHGPVWVACAASLTAAGATVEESIEEEGLIRVAAEMKLQAGDRLNLGWLLLQVDGKAFELPEALKSCIPQRILSRTVLVPDNLFSHIVNDNLEVRTSVSIDPGTGAAREHALFTYEAIPRTAVMQCEVTTNDPSLFRVPPDGQKPSFLKEELKEKIYEAADYMQWLGIGGMNTRGMGRMRVISTVNGGGQ